VTYPRLRVVAARIDPCFPVLTGATCRHQIRFVVQAFGGDFGDSALHVFYDLPEADFDTLLTELLSISGAVPKDAPLGVHPLLTEQGTRGAYARALKKILFSHVGAQRITRVTATQLVKIGFSWTFRGFDFTNGASPTPIGIAGSKDVAQNITGFGTNGFDTPPTPVFAPDAPFSLFWDSTKTKSAPLAQQQSAFDAARSPSKHLVHKHS